MEEHREPPSASKPPRPGPRASPTSATATTSTASTATNSGSEESGSEEEAPDDEGALRDYARVDHRNRRAAAENARLRLNLGLPLDLALRCCRRDDEEAGVSAAGVVPRVLRPPIQLAVRLLDRLLACIESPLFRVWSQHVPLRLRQRLTFLAWGLYLPLHKALIGRRSGLHKDVSLEYHALTSIMWWGRLFPITIKRMRFSLSQLHACHPPDRYPRWSAPSRDAAVLRAKPTNGARHGIRGHLHEVYFRMDSKRTPTGVRDPAGAAAGADMTVTGHYVQHASRPSKKVLFWIYGGAYLAGDGRGNLGIAEKMGMLCGEDDHGMRDVFIPDYRLVPEHHLDDATHDITLAFEYLVRERGVRPDDITLVGISSGGGLVVLLLQALAQAQRDCRKGEGERGRGALPLPAGGVLMGPFVDYTEPSGSMKEYIKHDLIVNQSVYDVGIPYLEKVLGRHRLRASPVYGSFEGLPPLCICVSQHEVVYDQTMLLAKRAKEHGVEVTVGVWKYMCHVFPLLCPFIPEGRESFDFMCQWIRER